MVTAAEALVLILDRVDTLGSEIVPHAAALGRTLAQDVVAALELPPFDNSAMDGYALIAADVQDASEAAPVRLQLLETIGAGEVATRAVQRRQCLKIMTGAPLPDGADAVVMREETRESGAIIEILATVKQGENIRRTGSDVAQGETVLRSGTVVKAAQWAMLASLGQREVAVVKRPRVGIIATGIELVDLSATLQEGQIRDSNSYALRALAAESGAEIVTVRHSGDSTAEFEQVLREVTTQCDLVITSGGVSAGDFDPVRDVLRQSAEVHFWKIAMKPGKPVMFAHFEGIPVFGLPGNPVSVMVSFEEFARPALLQMGGRSALKRIEVQARLETPLRSPSGKTEFVRAMVLPKNGEWSAKISGDQGSGRLSTMTRANALLVVPAETTVVEAGETVLARLIDCPEID